MLQTATPNPASCGYCCTFVTAGGWSFSNLRTNCAGEDGGHFAFANGARGDRDGYERAVNSGLWLHIQWKLSEWDIHIYSVISRSFFHNTFSQSTNVHVMDTASIIKTWLPQSKGSALSKQAFTIPGLGAGVLLPHSASWVCRWNSHWVRTSASGRKAYFHHFDAKVMSDLSSWSTVSKEFALPPYGPFIGGGLSVLIVGESLWCRIFNSLLYCCLQHQPKKTNYTR